MTRTKKPSSASAIEMRELVMPHHTNPRNTIFGGVVMSWIDTAAAMAAHRHTQKSVVTANIDNISFKSPIGIGEHVVIKASVNYVGKSSIEVGCKVLAENPFTAESRHTTTAYLTFVALDDDNRPTEDFPLLEVISSDEKRRFEQAQKRVEARKKLYSSKQ